MQVPVQNSLLGKLQSIGKKPDVSDIREFMASLDKKFGNRKDWKDVRSVVRSGVYPLLTKAGIARITGIERPAKGQTVDQFHNSIHDQYRIPDADSELKKAEMAIASGNLTRYTQSKDQFITRRATSQAEETARVQAEEKAKKERRQAELFESMPFTLQDYADAPGNVVRMKPEAAKALATRYPGGVIPLGDAKAWLDRVGIAPSMIPPATTPEQPAQSPTTGPLRPNETAKEDPSIARQVGDEAADFFFGETIRAFTDPESDMGTIVGAMLEWTIPGMGLIAKGAGKIGAAAAKKLFGSTDDLAKALEKMGIPDHIKVAEKAKQIADDPQFVGYWESIGQQGKGGVEGFGEQLNKKLAKEAGDVVDELPPQATQKGAQASTPTEIPLEGQKPVTGQPGGKQATSLANQEQYRQVSSGVIKDVPSQGGKSAEEWQAIGKQRVDEGADYMALADEVEAGKIPSGEDFGVLLEGDRRLYQDVIKAQEALLKSPGDKNLIEALRKAEVVRQDYLKSVQVGKGATSDAFRALQAGTTLDEGVYADVVQRMKSGGHATKSEYKAAEEASRKVSDVDTDIADYKKASRQSAEENLRPTDIGKLTGSRPGESTIDALERLRKDFSPDNIKKYAQALAREGDDFNTVIAKVQDEGAALKRPVSVQETIDAIAAKAPPQTRSEAAKRVAELIGSARKRSTDRYVDEALTGAKKDLEEQIKTATLDERFALRKMILDIDDALKQVRKVAAAEAKATDTTARALRKQERDAWAKYQRTKDAAKKAEYKEAWRSALKEADDAQAALDREIKAGIKAGLRGGDAAARETEATIKALRKDAQKAFDKLQKIPLKEARDAYKRWFTVQAQILDYKEQMLTGKFRKPTAKPASELDDLMAERNLWGSRVRGAIRASETPQWMKALENTAATIRGLSLGADIGVVFRQGLFGTARPAAFAKGLVAGGKTVFSEKNIAKYQYELDNARLPDGKALAPIRNKAGLDLSDTVNNREELMVSRWMKKIPGIGKTVGGALERFQVSYINTVRAEVFDAAVRRGYSAEELSLRAKFINNATGRGNFKEAPGILGQILFTSPRYEKSRWAILGEPLKNTVLLRAGSAKGTATGLAGFNRAALANLQDMAVTAGEVLLLFKAAEAGGMTVNYDPTSSDFLKMRDGEEVWDVTAGIAPRMRDFMRMYVYAQDPNVRKNWTTVVGKSVVRALSPAVRLPSEKGVAAMQGRAGKAPVNPFTGYKFEDEEMEWASWFPLVIQATIEAGKIDGIQGGAEAFAKEFVGTSVSRYPRSAGNTASGTSDAARRAMTGG